MSNVLEIENGCFAYNNQSITGLFIKKNKNISVIKNLNLKIQNGDKIGIIGRNGSGKSTLLKVLSKKYTLDSGIFRSKIEFLQLDTENLGFNNEMSGEENVINILNLAFNHDKKKLKKSYRFIKKLSELSNYFKFPLNNYSAGMKARILFSTAIAIIKEKLIENKNYGILIDELLSAGDIFFKSKIQHILNEILNDPRLTLIIVSHSNSDIIRFCNKALYLENGRIINQGSVINVLKKYEEDLYEEMKVFNSNIDNNELNDNLFSSNFYIKNSNKILQNFKGIKFSSVYLQNLKNKNINRLRCKDSFKICIGLKRTIKKTLPFRISLTFFSSKGDWLFNYQSPASLFNLKNKAVLKKEVIFKHNYFNKGPILITIGLHKTSKKISLNDHYQLLNRSFVINIIDGDNQAFIDKIPVRFR